MKKQKYQTPPGGFVGVDRLLLESQAYRSLPPTAGKMLPYFLGKMKSLLSTAETYYSTSFTFTFAEGRKYGCTKKTFYRVICALVQFGFIDPCVKGGIFQQGHVSSLFKLSKRWKRYGTAAFEIISWESFGQDQIKDHGTFRHCIGDKKRTDGASN